MSDRKLTTFIFLASLSAGLLLISNLAAVKLWNLFGIAVDGGVVCFPLTYIIGDLIVEFYGQKKANTIIISSFVMNLIAVLTFWIVIALPAYHGWDMQDAFASVLGFAPRIIIGSLVAFLASNFLNNYVFTRMKNGKGWFAKSYIARALGSSVFARLVDSALFETIAFIGVLPFNEFLMQAGFAYILGLVFEIIFAPIAALVAKKLHKFLDEPKKVSHARK